MAEKLGGSIQILKVRDGSVPSYVDNEESFKFKIIIDILSRYLAGEFLVRQIAKESDVGKEVRVAICGDMDAGKSTLLGVLSTGELDNGRGQARMNIFKHKHELENGRTSAIGREILGFDAEGSIVNYSSIQTPTWREIIENSAKVVCFVDLAGHKRYRKTTVCGMTGHFPDYAMLLVGSKVGMVGTTKDHYNLTVALQIPIIIVITKIDICSEETLQERISSIKNTLESGENKKTPVVIENEEDVIDAAKCFYSNNLAPIFQISNVTGANLDLLRLFLSIVNPVRDWNAQREKGALLYIDDTFSVPDVGTVISGTLLQGKIEFGDTLLLGPDQNNEFIEVTIPSIHANRLPVQVAYAGQSVCLALDNIERDICRKGQVLVSKSVNPKPIWEFDASVCLVSKASLTPQKYETVVHCGCSQQTAILVKVENEELFGAGVPTHVRFQYKYRSEFLQRGVRFIFREGSSYGVGTVLQVYHTTTDLTSLRDVDGENNQQCQNK